MRVSKCPQAAIVRCAARAEPAMLLSAQGLDVHVWQLGSALDRQHQVCTAVTSWQCQSCRFICCVVPSILIPIMTPRGLPSGAHQPLPWGNAHIRLPSLACLAAVCRRY